MTKKKATKESISMPPAPRPVPPPDMDPGTSVKGDSGAMFIAAGILLAILIGLVIVGLAEGRL